MEETDALDFYERVTEGTENYEEITLEHRTGAALEGVRMHIVDKQVLARTISALPEDMFDAVEDVEDPEQAQEQLEEEGGSLNAVSEETVEAFENLLSESLNHPELTSSQMSHIVSELDFEILFELGTEVINMSVDQTGTVRDFHKRG